MHITKVIYLSQLLGIAFYVNKSGSDFVTEERGANLAWIPGVESR